MIRAFATLALAAALVACAPTPARRAPDAALLAAQAAREATLAGMPAWALTGRIAVSDGRDGGSGRIDWFQDGDDFDIRLSAPVSRQSWRLLRRGGVVRLEGLDGGPREGDDPQRLLWEATGWLIPVEALAAWVRGARAPGAAALEFGPEGLPALLLQHDWRVEYRLWDAAAAPPRPLRVFASRGDARVRLTVDRWDWPAPDVSARP
ncbi:lipoprotein insertase outer membrane protein LolB [Rehaibacterium terrae]|uniref:Outer-membrane lipoprotein LolB n=1 Tax=Rehaibacterium terrae TaxID=1341696 RepID=A0A7W7Y1U6_9GAMM|nr:outer membrane lipoprotein LolB [Rehaibacterium terrae]